MLSRRDRISSSDESKSKVSIGLTPESAFEPYVRRTAVMERKTWCVII